MAVGGELCSKYSYFCTYVVDICHGCDFLSSYEQLFYIWGHSYIMTTSSQHWSQDSNFQPPLQLGCRHMTWGPPTRRTVREFISEVSKECKQSCAQLSIVWMGDGRGIELWPGISGEKLGFGGNFCLISSILQWGLGDCFQQRNPALFPVFPIILWAIHYFLKIISLTSNQSALGTTQCWH